MRLVNFLPAPWAFVFAVALIASAAAQQSSPSSTSSASSSTSTSSAQSTPSATPSSSSSTTASASSTSAASTVSSSLTSQVSITGSSQANTGSSLTGFPTLTGPGAIPTYPPPSVPPTQNAPYMQQSNLPDGTVFIVVGAILGALGLALLLWRSIVSLMLHRSVERAAMAHYTSDTKNGYSAPSATFYKYADQASSMSLGGAGGAPTAAPAGRSLRRTSRGPIPSSTPSQSNLFFSPTAGSGAASNRGSTFLPSGFYTAGTSSPGGGNRTSSINLSNLRPDSHGQYANASRNNIDISPPDSPQAGARRNLSTSSLNVSLAPGQRAPSAYLEDLLMDGPIILPPSQISPLSRPRRPSSPANRI